MTITNPLIEMASKARFIRLFLDYDGTLADFAPSPDTVIPDQELIGLIKGLVSTKKILPAIISGRRLSHVQQLMPISGVILGGTYGIEMQLADGEIRTFCRFTEVRPVIDKIIPEFNALISNKSGFFLEDKGWGIALHGLNASAYDAAQVYPMAENLLEQKTEGDIFRIISGERFLELVPAMADKSKAVKFILEEMTPEGALALFIGDDDKDEKAIQTVVSTGGYGIRVMSTPGETMAQLILKNPLEVRAWLKAL